MFPLVGCAGRFEDMHEAFIAGDEAQRGRFLKELTARLGRIEEALMDIKRVHDDIKGELLSQAIQL